MQPLEKLNSLPDATVLKRFLECCHSTLWAKQLVTARPFFSVEGLVEESSRIWLGLSMGDWLEAASHHPRIGDKSGTRDSREEQKGITTSDELKQLNEAYQERFGFVYLVCASGKNGAEVLADLKARIKNSREVEIERARDEIQLITALRLRKLMETL